MVDFMEKQSAAEKPNAGVKSAEAEFVRFKDVYRFYKMGDRSVGAIITYCIIALAAIWLIVYTVFANGILRFTGRRDDRA